MLTADFPVDVPECVCLTSGMPTVQSKEIKTHTFACIHGRICKGTYVVLKKKKKKKVTMINEDDKDNYEKEYIS